MNALILIDIYSLIDNNTTIVGKLLSPLRLIVRFGANKLIPHYLSMAKLPIEKTGERLNKKVIVSLTSFPARINEVWMVVKNMMLQDYSPDKVILWLSKEQFKSIKCLPNSLLQLQGEIFEIRFVDNDYKSHKKYLYAFQEFRNDIVIIIDDDIFYPQHLVKNMIKLHKKQPHAVVCNYGSYISYDGFGIIKSYKFWKRNKSLISKNFFFGSGGGTLFLPRLLHIDTTNISLAYKLTPKADDIWLNAMVRLSSLPIIVQSNNHVLSIHIREDERLCDDNVSMNQNDAQLKNVISYYIGVSNINPFEKQC